MDLETLQIFVDVFRRSSFSAVAKERGVAPSSISRAIDGLEAQLGVRLFQRTTRHVASTEAGTEYFARVEPLVEEMRGAAMAVADLAGAPRGVLRLTASVSFGLTCVVPMLARFSQAYPELQVDLVLTDAVIDVAAERIDVALRQGPLADSSLIARRILPARYSLCASPAYLQCQAAPTTASDLSGHRCLAFSATAGHARWLLRLPGEAAQEIALRPHFAINNGLALKQCALDGAGIALLSDWLVREEIRSGALVPLLTEYEATPNVFEPAIWLVVPTRAYVPRKVSAFVEFLEGELRPGL